MLTLGSADVELETPRLLSMTVETKDDGLLVGNAMAQILAHHLYRSNVL